MPQPECGRCIMAEIYDLAEEKPMLYVHLAHDWLLLSSLQMVLVKLFVKISRQDKRTEKL